MAIAMLALVAPTASPAFAGECTPICDDLFNPNCYQCSTAEVAEDYENIDVGADGIEVRYSQSRGNLVAADLLRNETIQSLGKTVIVGLQLGATSNPLLVFRKNYAEGTREKGRSKGRQAGGREVASDARPSVARDQGPVRTADPWGSATDAGKSDGNTDPVNPLNGEFYISETDLAFPGFGIPFVHERTYRSRVDIESALGPAWDYSYNQRLVLVLEPAKGIDWNQWAENPWSETDTSDQPWILDDLPVLAESPGQRDESSQQASCGHLLLFGTGEGASLAFRSISPGAEDIVYESPAADLELRGKVVDGETTWTMMSRAGDVRHFDNLGRLARWVDANGVGLSFEWAQVAGKQRLVRVVDSVGRTIEYQHDAQGRLERVYHAASGLEASYTYSPVHGALVSATDSAGRAESYEYDYQADRPAGDWIPEARLRSTCETQCSSSSASCNAGGLCDTIVEDTMSACLSSCNPCAAECKASCPDMCDDACRNGIDGEPGCAEACGAGCAYSAPSEDPAYPTMIQQYQAECEERWDDHGKDFCSDMCDRVCEAEVGSTCQFAFNCAQVLAEFYDAAGTDNVNIDPSVDLCSGGASGMDLLQDIASAHEIILDAHLDALQCVGSVVLCAGGIFCDLDCDFDSVRSEWRQMCDQQALDCCKDGVNCPSGSCNAGHSCTDDCRATYFGYPNGNECLAPSAPWQCLSLVNKYPPAMGTPEYDAVRACEGALADDWTVVNGCIPKSRESCRSTCTGNCLGECVPDCIPSCQTSCNEVCHVEDCADHCESFDIATQCSDGCMEGCMAASHENGPLAGPKYGFERDLNFNITHVYDGQGRLYLHNQYGTALGSPDFDAVIAQDFGGHEIEMDYRDLAGERAGTEAAPTGLAASHVDDDYRGVEICPYLCEDDGGARSDIAVPWADSLLVFAQHGATSRALPAGSKTLTGAVSPLLINLVDDDGALRGRIAQRSAAAAALPDGASVSIILGAGRVDLVSDGSEWLTVAGSASAKNELVAIGQVTVLRDTGGTLRAFRGFPESVLRIHEGSCSQPLTISRTSESAVSLAPRDACTQTLSLSALASAVSDNAAKSAYLTGTPPKPGASFQATALTPGVGAFRWTASIAQASGGYTLKAKPSAPSSTALMKTSISVASASPLLSPPALAADLAGPLYVFHAAPTVKDDISADIDPVQWERLPKDPLRADLEVDGYVDTYCDPDNPEPPRYSDDPDGPVAFAERATVIADWNGRTWTYYFDEAGQLIRKVQHEVDAVHNYNFDENGRLIAAMAPDGVRACLRYDGGGNLVEALTLPGTEGVPGAQAIRQKYAYAGAPARPTKVYDPRDPSKVLRKLGWDANGNLTSVTEATGETTTFELVDGDGPARGLPARIIAPDGSVTEVEYDLDTATVKRRVIDASGASPVKTEALADIAGRPTWALSPLGEVRTWQYQDGRLWRTTREADELYQTAEYTYYGDGWLHSVVTEDTTTILTYDLTGQLESRRVVANDGSAEAATECWLRAPNGELQEAVSPEGRRIRYTRDGAGRVAKVEAGALDPTPGAWDDNCVTRGAGVAGIVSEMVYDVAGRPTASYDAYGSETRYRYDRLGRLVQVLDASGVAHHTGYDALGNVIWQAAYEGVDVMASLPPAWGRPGMLAAETRYYDASGRLDRQDLWHFDASGPIGDGLSTRTIDYDLADGLVSVTDDAGATIKTYRDGAGRVIRRTGPLGIDETLSYLDGGLRVVATGAAQTESGTSNAITDLTAWGAVRASFVGGLGDPISMASYSYDERGLPSSMTSASGAVASMKYDAFGRLTDQWIDHGESSLEVLSFQHDRDGLMVERRSDSGLSQAVWSFGYDDLGRQTSTIDPAGRTTTTAHVAASGMVDYVVRNDGVTMDVYYDAAGRAILLRAVNPDGQELGRRGFEHDALGRIVEGTASSVEGDIVTTLGWDSLGNRTHEALVGFAGVSHAYDGRGLPVASDLAGVPVSRSFDALGRLTEVRDNYGLLAELEYELPGGPVGRRLGNGLTTHYTHDALGRLTGIRDQRAATGQLVADWTYAIPFDGAPRAATLKRPQDSVGAVYQVDPAGRLLAETHGIGAALPTLAPGTAWGDANQSIASRLDDGSDPRSYQLDGRSNVIAHERGGSAITPAIAPDDAYLDFGADALVYDALGSVIDDGARTYDYDAFGAVSAVRSTDAEREYLRDAFGRIVVAIDPATGDRTELAYDGIDRALRRLPDSGSVEVTVFAGVDTPIARLDRTGDTFYFHQDRNANVYLISDAAGDPVEWYQYTAYGEMTITDAVGGAHAASLIDNHFGFQGQRFDAAVGLVDMRARFYDPRTARFLSRDPIGLADGSNLYAFVGSAPLLFTDPLGLGREKEPVYWSRHPSLAYGGIYPAYMVDVMGWDASGTTFSNFETDRFRFHTNYTVVNNGDRVVQYYTAVSKKHPNGMFAVGQYNLEEFLSREARFEFGAGIIAGYGEPDIYWKHQLAMFYAGMEGEFGPIFYHHAAQWVEARDDPGFYIGTGMAGLGRGLVRTRSVVFENRYPGHTIGAPLQEFSIRQARSRGFNRKLNYVVTEDGTLRLGRIKDELGGGHIDLANGSPVRAAGEAKIVGGELKWASNKSGHYQPHGPAARAAAERAFREAGFDVDGRYVEMDFD